LPEQHPKAAILTEILHFIHMTMQLSQILKEHFSVLFLIQPTTTHLEQQLQLKAVPMYLLQE